MFQKIKDIKKYIRLAKIGGVIFGIIFLTMLGMIIFQQAQIQDIKARIYQLESNFGEKSSFLIR